VGERNNLEPLPDQRSLITARVFAAPRALVWAAWTKPEHLAHWWGPIGFSTTTHAFDFRPGGVWRFVMRGADGREYQNRITFDEIVKPERIRYRHGDDVELVRFCTTATFEDLGGSHTRLTLHALFPTAADRDRVVRDHRADKGAAETLGRLADYLAQLSA
jgi:uncharacterized protein YndB with AHSA1/START domain